VNTECVEGKYSSGTVRHASLKARIRKFNRRCAGSVEVEETYSLLLFDKGRGSAVRDSVLVLPASFSRNTEGKCVCKRIIASSTRPDDIWDRISEEYHMSLIWPNRTIIDTLTKRNLFHEVFKLFRGAAGAITFTWFFCIDRFDNFVAVGIEVSDRAVSGECCSRTGITAMAEIVEHQGTLQEKVSNKKI
jgi:hypothetical protein